MLSPPWIALNRSATVGPLLVHQHPAPLPRSGFVLRPILATQPAECRSRKRSLVVRSRATVGI